VVLDDRRVEAPWGLFMPDGLRVAHIERSTLLLTPLDGGDAREIPLPEALASSPSCWPSDAFQDGKRLLLGCESKTGASLWIFDATSKAARRFADGTGMGAVSPDGTRVAFRTHGGIYVRPVDGGGETLVASLAVDVGVLFQFSPDGKALAILGTAEAHRNERVAARGFGRSWIDVVSVDGASTRRIVEDRRLSSAWDGPMALAWADTGELFYVLYAQPPDERTSTLMGQSFDASGAPNGPPRAVRAWTGITAGRFQYAAGRMLYNRSVPTGAISLHRLAPDLGAIVSDDAKLGLGGGSTLLAGWTRDGRLLLTSRTGGVSRLSAMSRDGTSVELLHDEAPLAGFSAAGPGELLAWRMPMGPTDPCTLLAIGETGVIRTVLEATSGGLACGSDVRCATATRGACFVLQRKGGTTTLQPLDLAKGSIGDPIWSTGEIIATWDVSRDAKTLAAFVDPSFTIVSLDRPEIRTADLHPAFHAQRLAFVPSARSVLVTGWSSDSPRALAVYDLQGRGKVLRRGDTSTWLADPMMAPDGTTLALYERDYSSQDEMWLLEPRR
jgi:hypothetical protein